MRLFGATRVRNEAHIIGDTLDHVAGFCEKIFVYDDASTDGTGQMCLDHPAVAKITPNHEWDPTPAGRQRMEGHGRQVPYDQAVEAGADYVYVFDADEFAEIVAIPTGGDSYALRLFDFYITAEDAGGTWRDRVWMGPEYRDIPMVFKAVPGRRFRDRVPGCDCATETAPHGHVRHYGKAISPEVWDDTCDYYVKHRWADGPRHLRERWAARKGHAVHTVSDFGAELIRWEDRTDEKKIIKNEH